MSFRDRFLFLALVLFLCFSGSVVWAAAAGPEKIELKVNQLPNFSGQDIGSRAESAVVRAFLKKYPSITLIKGTGLMIQGGSNTMDMVPLMQIAGDISPTVLYVNYRLSDTYIQSGFLRPLDDFVAKIPPAELARRVPPAVKPVIYRTGPDGKKHWWAIPTNKLVRVLTWRRDRFAQAGLDPDRAPTTWTEMEEYAKKLTKPKSNRYGMGFTKGDISSWDFVNLLWSRGGEVVSQDADGNWHPNFNSPEMVDALYFYLRMTATPWKGPDGEKLRGFSLRDAGIGLFMTGEPIAMSFTYLDQRLNVHEPGLVGFGPVPHSEKAPNSASEINSMMLGIYSGHKDPKLVDAAWKYMSYLDSDEANSIRTKIYVQNGFGKFVDPLLLEQFGYTDYLKQVDKAWIKVYKYNMQYGKPEPYGKNCAVVYREMSRPIEQAINDKTALAALDKGDEVACKARLKQILDVAQVETAKRMYGTLPAPVKKMRLNLTLIFLICTVIVFTGATVYLMKVLRTQVPSGVPSQSKLYWAVLLLLPAAITVVVWQYLPLFRGTVMAFQDYNIMGNSRFVGVENFSTILFDPNFWHSIMITLVYVVLYMVFAFLSPIFLAILLSEVPKGKVLFRTLFYLPAVLSGLVVAFLWKSFYTPTGLLNSVLGYLHLDKVVMWIANSDVAVNWLDNPKLAMAAILLPVIWGGMGPGSLIYLAAFKTIPEDLYEAAEVDGAGIRRKIWNITLPSIRMLILINAVGAFMGAFMAADMVFAMTGGGPYTPDGATEMVGLQLFYTAFMYLKFGVANAMAWVLGFMLIGFTLLQLKTLSRVEFKGGR